MNRKGHYTTLCAAILAATLAGCAKHSSKPEVDAGATWNRIATLTPPQDKILVTASGPESIRFGETFALNLLADADGKAWVVQVDSKDAATVLFPNSVATDNTIRKGQPLTLPTEGWELVAAEPAGKSLIAVIVTSGDVDPYALTGLPAPAETTKGVQLATAPAGKWGVAYLKVEVTATPAT
jgi:hypothetical protein